MSGNWWQRPHVWSLLHFLRPLASGGAGSWGRGLGSGRAATPPKGPSPTTPTNENALVHARHRRGRNLSPVCAILLALLCDRSLAKPLPLHLCPNDCDFHFEGFSNGTVPAFNLTAARHGPIAISPRILYGKSLGVQVYASGPAVLLGRTFLKNTVEGVRRLAQTRHTEPVYVAREALTAASVHALLEGVAAPTKGNGDSRNTIRYSFYAASADDLSPAFLFQEPFRSLDEWKAASWRCFKLPLIKLRVFYWRNKFQYLTEGDGNGFFPESRRCVVFRTR